MRFTVELGIGLSFLLQAALPPASDRSRDEDSSSWAVEPFIEGELALSVARQPLWTKSGTRPRRPSLQLRSAALAGLLGGASVWRGFQLFLPGGHEELVAVRRCERAEARFRPVTP